VQLRMIALKIHCHAASGDIIVYRGFSRTEEGNPVANNQQPLLMVIVSADTGGCGLVEEVGVGVVGRAVSTRANSTESSKSLRILATFADAIFENMPSILWCRPDMWFP